MVESSDVDRAFAEALVNVRTERGLSRNYVADEMTKRGFDLHVSAIGKIERGERRVTVGEASALSAIVGVKQTDYMLGDGPDPRREVDSAAFRLVYAIDHIGEAFQEVIEHSGDLDAAVRRFDALGEPYEAGQTAREFLRELLELPVEVNVPATDLRERFRA